MTILPLDEQERIRAWVRSEYPDASPDEIRLSEIHVAAIRVLAQTLGREWCDQAIKPLAQVGEHDFLHRNLADRNDSLMHVDRVIYLAEYLTCLSPMPNFEAKVQDLRAKGLEETFYELRVAHSLQLQHRLVKFVAPSGVKGQDFDLEARLGAEPIAVEVKCLTDEPRYTDTLLYNRLKKAATQLPATGGGIIFVMLPSSWIGVEVFEKETKTAIDSIFRNYSRVNAIFLHWEEWSGGPPFARFLKFFPAISNAPKRAVSNIARLIRVEVMPPLGTRQRIDVSYI